MTDPLDEFEKEFDGQMNIFDGPEKPIIYNDKNLSVPDIDLTMDLIKEKSMLEKALQQETGTVGLHALFDKPQAEIQERIWIGVDPGKNGGIVALSQRGIIGKWIIPLIGDDVDPVGIWNILAALQANYYCTVILEEVHSLHKMAANTNFSMGHTLGIILGIVVSNKFKLIRTQPKAWQKEVWITSEIEYLPIKPDQKKPSINTKLTSLKAAHRLFPGQDFRKSARASVPHDGIIDAVCIAEFGRRKNL